MLDFHGPLNGRTGFCVGILPIGFEGQKLRGELGCDDGGPDRIHLYVPMGIAEVFDANFLNPLLHVPLDAKDVGPGKERLGLEVHLQVPIQRLGTAPGCLLCDIRLRGCGNGNQSALN